MFLILLTFSFGLAWREHSTSILPFLLALYAAFDKSSWQQCRELGLAIFRMRVPVIVALIAFAIYTNDQILEVLAMPYQAGAEGTEVIPLLSFIVTAMALWLWARFFSWFELKALAGAGECEQEKKPSWWHKFLPWLLLVVFVVAHGVLYSGIEAVVSETRIAGLAMAAYIAPAVTAVSLVSWLYFACVLNTHLPFSNNLPDALESLPYHLQVRTVVLRPFPIMLPNLLVAATVYNVLPRVDPGWSADKLQWALGTFFVLSGVGFLVDDLFVRFVYLQNVYVRDRLGQQEGRIRDSIRRVLKRSPRRLGPNVVYALELIVIFVLAIISLATRFRLGFVAMANILVNVALGLGFTRFLRANRQYNFDKNLWASYFLDAPIPDELAPVKRWPKKRAAQLQTGDAQEAGPVAPGRNLADHWPVFLKRSDHWGAATLFAGAAILASYHIWPDTVLGDNAYYLLAAVFVLSVLPFLPILAAFLFLILIVFSPVTFLIGPFVDALKLSPSSETLLVINIFIVASLGFFALLLLFSYRRPLIGLFFGLIVLLATFDLNDNHAIPRASPQTEAAAVPVVTAFDDWLGQRLKRWPQQGSAAPAKHPVYIVAAEGGGAYAALHAALFLAQAQDEFSDFADHVFAISGVSGGSVGGAVFASLLRESAGQARDPEWYSRSTRKLLKADLLTPVITGTLFHDTIARLIPCLDYTDYSCPTRRLDRSREFEKALERAWDERLGKGNNPFEQTLTQLWSPAADVPALLLNTTEVETGERVVLAPFTLQKDVPTLKSLIDRDPGLDIKLSTASGLSARFPGLMAPGWFRSETDNPSFKRRLVDGGYFEDSGVATAFDLLTSLEKSLNADERARVELILISVKLADREGLASEPPHGFLEIMTPLRTLNNTRAARGKLALDQASLSLDGAVCRDKRAAGSQAHADPSCFYAGRVRISELEDGGKQSLPLGWLLSKASKDRIGESIGKASECPEMRGGMTIRERNSCLLHQIGKDLSAGIEVQAKPAVPAWTTEVQGP